MRNVAIYRYPQGGIALSRWTRWTGYLLKTFAGLSVAWFDFALLLLAVRESLMLSYLLPSTWASAISNALPFG
jgi:hypothetical protein